MRISRIAGLLLVLASACCSGKAPDSGGASSGRLARWWVDAVPHGFSASLDGSNKVIELTGSRARDDVALAHIRIVGGTWGNLLTTKTSCRITISNSLGVVVAFVGIDAASGVLMVWEGDGQSTVSSTDLDGCNVLTLTCGDSVKVEAHGRVVTRSGLSWSDVTKSASK